MNDLHTTGTAAASAEAEADSAWPALDANLLAWLREKYEIHAPVSILFHGDVFQPKHWGRVVPGSGRKPGPQKRTKQEARIEVFKAYNRARAKMSVFDAEPSIQDAARALGITSEGFRKMCRRAGLEPYEWPPPHRPDCPNRDGAT